MTRPCRYPMIVIVSVNNRPPEKMLVSPIPDAGLVAHVRQIDDEPGTGDDCDCLVVRGMGTSKTAEFENAPVYHVTTRM